MFVDSNTLEALQIFKQEAHPSRLGIGTSKEGLSLFGIMNEAKTPAGRRLLRYDVCHPSPHCTGRLLMVGLSRTGNGS